MTRVVRGTGPGVGVGVGTGVGTGSVVGSGVGSGVGAGEGFEAGTKAPLFHTSFFPLFTHVNFLPAAVIVCPAFLHAEPGFGAVAAWAEVAMSRIESMSVRARICFDIPTG